MERSKSCELINVFYIPPYYENDFQSAIDRFTSANEKIEYRIFTLEKRVFTLDLNRLLTLCRTILSEENDVRVLFTDSDTTQLIVGKLVQEYPRIRSGGGNFLQTLEWLDRSSIKENPIPTLVLPIDEQEYHRWTQIEQFLSQEKSDGYVKPMYGSDYQLSSFRFTSAKEFEEQIETYRRFYHDQHMTQFQSLFRIYVPSDRSASFVQARYLVQPYFDLVQYPHWRLVIANACIYEQEIIMWPLVDGYSGWPYFAQRPLAILPILVCPSQHLSVEQQQLLYARFREDLNVLISKFNLRFGWMEYSYFISCSNDIRLISMKPKCSVHLIEAFQATCQHAHPIKAFLQMSARERPTTPILNGKIVHIHRLWTKNPEGLSPEDLIDFTEVERIHRLRSTCPDRYLRLRFNKNDPIPSQTYTEVGFIQVYGEYAEIALTNLIEFRSMLLKQPSSFPFAHSSMLVNDPDQFDRLTCSPSQDLLEQLAALRDEEEKDLI